MASKLLSSRRMVFVFNRSFWVFWVLIPALAAPMTSVSAYSTNIHTMANQVFCGGCHSSSTRPSPPANQALILRDLETGNLVSKYQAGKSYSVELSFNPQTGLNGNHRVGYFIRSVSSSRSAAGEFTTTPTIVTPDGGPELADRIYRISAHHMARVFNSTSAVQAQVLKLNWKAPASPETIRFEFSRVESNSDGNSGFQDRGSISLEVVSIEGQAANIQPTSNSNESDNEEPGGCGVIRKNTEPSSTLLITLTLILICLGTGLRRRHRATLKLH